MRKLLILTGVLLLILCVRLYLFYKDIPDYADGEYITFETTVTSPSQIFSNTQTLSAKTAFGENFFITTGKYSEFFYGEHLRISGTVKNKLLSNNRTVRTMYFPKIERTYSVVKSPFFLVESALALVYEVRQNVIVMFQKTLSNQDASLLLGIVFGIQQSMPKEFKNQLKTVGVIHVVAASGMNVSMVAGFLYTLCLSVFKRQYSFGIAIIGIWLYAVFAGFEPSILRATVMGTGVLIAGIIGRQTWSGYFLLLTGFFMLLYAPSLLFDIGFQLSFLATAGLIYISPLAQRMIMKKGIGWSLVTGDFSTTLSAQIATIPILLFYFGTYSLWSIVVNMLVLWTIPILMVLGGSATLISFLIPVIGKWLLYASLPFLIYFNTIVSIFSRVEEGVVHLYVSWQMVIGYYLALSSLVMYWHSAKRNGT